MFGEVPEFGVMAPEDEVQRAHNLFPEAVVTVYLDK